MLQRFRTTFAGAGTEANVVPTHMRILPYDAQVRIAAAQETGNSIKINVFIGGELVARDSYPPQEGVAGRGPILPDDIILEDGGLQGQEVVIEAVAGAAKYIEFLIEYIPL